METLSYRRYGEFEIIDTFKSKDMHGTIIVIKDSKKDGREYDRYFIQSVCRVCDHCNEMTDTLDIENSIKSFLDNATPVFRKQDERVVSYCGKSKEVILDRVKAIKTLLEKMEKNPSDERCPIHLETIRKITEGDLSDFHVFDEYFGYVVPFGYWLTNRLFYEKPNKRFYLSQFFDFHY